MSQKKLREAFKRGFKLSRPPLTYDEAQAERLAQLHYPPKLVTRPRIVNRGGILYRIFEGKVQWTTASDPDNWTNDSDEAQIALDLAANPTETVEEDE